MWLTRVYLYHRSHIFLSQSSWTEVYEHTQRVWNGQGVPRLRSDKWQMLKWQAFAGWAWGLLHVSGLLRKHRPSVQKNELCYLAPHLSSTKEMSCVCVRDTYKQFGEDWRGACSIFHLASSLLVTGCFHTMMNDTVQYVKGKIQKTNEKGKYKLQK